MPNTVVVGSQWGDEGKAKIIDYLTEKADIIIRFQGGANAGHTVIANGEKFIFHVIPSGVLSPSKVCVIGNGVVFDAEECIKEINNLKSRGISVENRLFISGNAHLVLPFHKEADMASESIMKSNKIGTTGRGIGPAYADKINRIGIRVGDLLNFNTFSEKVSAVLNQKKALIENVYNSKLITKLEDILDRYKIIREDILPLICDTANYIFESLKEKKNLLFEGAQGTFLDIDHGTFPFVTSSNTVSAAACTGSGVSPRTIDQIIGIVKSYTTRVGNGPFPTELSDDEGKILQQKGSEFGATTGRPRRCGWIDMVMLKKSAQLNGFTHIALTKLDVLNSFDNIKICTHYKIEGKKYDVFPSFIEDFTKITPVYETLPGWKEDISGFNKFSELPGNAQKYISRISELCYEVPVLIVSVGADRQQTIQVE
ncbi:MAG: adenylosuccinate synthase [Chitinispirillia bacterium]|jgi:adenylosuccinate synthase